VRQCLVILRKVDDEHPLVLLFHERPAEGSCVLFVTVRRPSLPRHDRSKSELETQRLGGWRFGDEQVRVLRSLKLMKCRPRRRVSHKLNRFGVCMPHFSACALWRE
jgi:hypothetical protein